MVVVGVDGCRHGWLAVVLRPDREPAAFVRSTIGEVAAAVPDADIIAIDIPIGLPDGDLNRAADLDARKFLGPRRNSVFPTPQRAVLNLPTWEEVSAETRRRIGKGISKQAFALLPKIAEVDQWVLSTSLHVVEVHPEVCFAQMTGAPAASAKKTEAGKAERLNALQRQGISVNHILRDRAIRAGSDDVLDAAAAAWTGRRVAAGEARSFPDQPPTDRSGRPVAIWA